MPRRLTILIVAATAGGLAGLAGGDNLQYWLGQAKPAATQPVRQAAATSRPATQPLAAVPRDDAWPGAVELSDGRVLAGMCHTTRDRPWEVYVQAERRWRRIPPLAVLSITAVVREESYENQWRWGGMGTPERVYTGRRRPFRRLEWTFRLADDSEITGTVKGQPLWVDSGGNQAGPFVLHERDKGRLDSTLEELLYVKHVVVSRRAMQQVLAASPASRPAE